MTVLEGRRTFHPRLPVEIKKTDKKKGASTLWADTYIFHPQSETTIQAYNLHDLHKPPTSAHIK